MGKSHVLQGVRARYGEAHKSRTRTREGTNQDPQPNLNAGAEEAQQPKARKTGPSHTVSIAGSCRDKPSRPQGTNDRVLEGRWESNEERWTRPKEKTSQVLPKTPTVEAGEDGSVRTCATWLGEGG